MANKDKEGNWQNRNGKYTNPKHIKAAQKRKDYIVTKAFNIAFRLQEKMKADKARIEKLIKGYLIRVAKDAKIKEDAITGNLNLSDYANLVTIDINTNDIVKFDENLNVAKALIDKCLNKWTKDSKSEIKAIVQNAFSVDKKGRFNRNAILGLRDIKISDPDWVKAMDYINDSLRIEGTRTYMQFMVRDGLKGKFKRINLNFSNL